MALDQQMWRLKSPFRARGGIGMLAATVALTAVVLPSGVVNASSSLSDANILPQPSPGGAPSAIAEFTVGSSSMKFLAFADSSTAFDAFGIESTNNSLRFANCGTSGSARGEVEDSGGTLPPQAVTADASGKVCEFALAGSANASLIRVGSSGGRIEVANAASLAVGDYTLKIYLKNTSTGQEIGSLPLTIRVTAGGSGGGSSSSAPDPRAATVAVVAGQVAAAGVEGSTNGVRVRGSEVLPVTSRLSGAVGPRGGVALSSDGLEVRVASVLGASAGSGVLVPSNGVFEASVTGALVPGSVVEVWINSQPRLVAAAEVPEDGDMTIAIPTGTPLDGGEPIEDGEHTLELRMYTEDGFEVVATGITVGQVVPTRIPAGEGPVPFDRALPLLSLFAAAGAVVAGRRLVTAG